jgi:fructose-bisphosphate aldolase class II
MLLSMKEMLDNANKNNYAVLAINCFNMETVRAAIEAAYEKSSPIIINIVQDHFQKHAKAELIAPVAEELAKNKNIPAALNLDHGKDYNSCVYALRNGFTSLMIDASSKPFAENVEITSEVVKLAKAAGLSVEGELGHIGSGSDYSEKNQKELYTDPGEVEQFFEKTGIDALAVRCGTAHGLYKEGTVPKINFELIEEIKNITKKPLVLHGGSGAGEENLRKAVRYGINKINIGADIFEAGRKKIYEELIKNPETELFELMVKMEEACKKEILKYLEISGSKGRAQEIIKEAELQKI